MSLQSNRSFLAQTILVALVSGCGGGVAAGSLNNDQPAQVGPQIDEWKGMSAPAIFAFSLLPALQVQLQASGTMADPNCPGHSMSGGTTTYTGGCTDIHGTVYAGTMTVTGGSIAGPPSGATYNNWSVTQHQTCMGIDVSSTTTANGSMTSSSGSNGATNFTVDVVLTGNGISASAANMMSCTAMMSPMATIAFSYSGSYTASGFSAMGASMSTWNGSGRAGSSLFGVANVSTSNEVIDNHTCQYTPLSGSTTISSNGDTAVITYQGATMCDMTATATWTLNGMPQANLMGVQCSVGRTPGRRGGSAIAGVALAGAFAACAWRRRRRTAKH